MSLPRSSPPCNLLEVIASDKRDCATKLRHEADGLAKEFLDSDAANEADKLAKLAEADAERAALVALPRLSSTELEFLHRHNSKNTNDNPLANLLSDDMYDDPTEIGSRAPLPSEAPPMPSIALSRHDGTTEANENDESEDDDMPLYFPLCDSPMPPPPPQFLSKEEIEQMINKAKHAPSAYCPVPIDGLPDSFLGNLSASNSKPVCSQQNQKFAPFPFEPREPPPSF